MFFFSPESAYIQDNNHIIKIKILSAKEINPPINEIQKINFKIIPEMVPMTNITKDCFA